MRFTFALVGAVALAGVATTASARDYLSIAGSSTVLPFAT
ncbi:MAG TPA: phosphate ABC transporter substrate-binding protein, partial [Alphaproteobacteria bacterium]|nr:phosphate ABC transporter substrate-binding protein [Alphaproteobacteria bacterium]